MTRDPRTNPQAGDELRGDGIGRRVVNRYGLEPATQRRVPMRDGDMLLVQSQTRRYWMRVETWREWCEKSGAQAAAAAKKEA